MTLRIIGIRSDFFHLEHDSLLYKFINKLSHDGIEITGVVWDIFGPFVYQYQFALCK